MVAEPDGARGQPDGGAGRRLARVLNPRPLAEFMHFLLSPAARLSMEKSSSE